MLLTTLLTSTAQVFYKFGTNNLSLSFEGIITNYYLITGLLIYGIGAAMLLYALKHGVLSVLYPIISTSYIWVLFLSAYFFSEPINFWKVIGIFSIVCGVSFIGFGAKNEGLPVGVP